MQFSLIVSTLNRTEELTKLFQSLQEQEYTHFELILVDQNEPGKLQPYIEPFRNAFKIKHITSTKGISVGRNEGMKHAEGDIIAFPDDDCWYQPDTLSNIARLLGQHQDYDGISVYSRDEHLQPSGGRFLTQGCLITRTNVWHTAISYTLFFKKKVITEVGHFNTNIGVGTTTPYKAGEETDYLIRCIDKGFRIQYSPELFIYHPNKILSISTDTLKKAFEYGCGMGYVLKVNKYGPFAKTKYLIKPLIAAFIYLGCFNINMSRYYWASFRGRLHGMTGGEDVI